MDRRLVAMVAAGGAAGTLLRAVIAYNFPPQAERFPWSTFVVNVVGSALLGWIIVTAKRKPDWFRPLLGTGLCGGLTTFSTFAVEIDLLLRTHCYGIAAGYAAASIGVGVIVAKLATAR